MHTRSFLNPILATFLSKALTIVLLYLLLLNSALAAPVCAALFDSRRQWRPNLIRQIGQFRFVVLDPSAPIERIEEIAAVIESSKEWTKGLASPAQVDFLLVPFGAGLHLPGKIAMRIQDDNFREFALHEWGHELARIYINERWPSIAEMQFAISKSLLPIYYSIKADALEDRWNKLKDELSILESKGNDRKKIADLQAKLTALTKKVELSDDHVKLMNAKFFDFDRFTKELLLVDISIAYQEVVSDLLVDLLMGNDRVSQVLKTPERGFYNPSFFKGEIPYDDHKSMHPSRLFIGRFLQKYPILKPRIIHIVLTAMANEMGRRLADPEKPVVVDRFSINDGFIAEIEKVAQRFLKP